jgi:hypothetical protein
MGTLSKPTRRKCVPPWIAVKPTRPPEVSSSDELPTQESHLNGDIEKSPHHIGDCVAIKSNEVTFLIEALGQLAKPLKPSSIEKIVRLLADIVKKQKKLNPSLGVAFSTRQSNCYFSRLIPLDENGNKTLKLLPALVDAGLLIKMRQGSKWSGYASTYRTTSEGWIELAKPMPKIKAKLEKCFKEYCNANVISRHLKWSCGCISHIAPDSLSKKQKKVVCGETEAKVKVVRERYYVHPFYNTKKTLRHGFRFTYKGKVEKGVEIDIAAAHPIMIPQLVLEQKMAPSNELLHELGRFKGLFDIADLYESLAPLGMTRGEAKDALNPVLNGGDAPGDYAAIKKSLRKNFPLIFGRLYNLMKSKKFGEQAARHLSNALKPVFEELERREIPALIYTDCLHVPTSETEFVSRLMTSYLSQYADIKVSVKIKNREV